MEIGTAGGAAAGVITVDSGASLSGSGTLDAAVTNRGTIIADGFLVAAEAVSGSGVLRIDARSDLVVDAAVSGQTIDFAGAEGRLDVSGYSSVVNGPGWLVSGTTITGFTAGDILAFRDDPIVSVVATSISGGENLTLTGIDGEEEQLFLSGATNATRYLLVPDDDDYLGYATLVVAVPTDAGKGKPAAGTATRDAYAWTGNVGSNWGSAGNWQDITAGGTAAIAPGRHDDVAFSPLGSTPTVVTGVGAAHSLTLESNSSLLLVGRFAFGTLNGGGSVIEAGATSRITVDVIRASDLDLQIESGMLRVGYAEGGEWTLSSGAAVEVERAQSLSRVSLDATSSFEIGTAGHAAAGKLTVDAGARLAGAWFILSDVVDNGTIRVGAVSDRVYGSLTGSGTVLIDAYGALSVDDAVSGVTIDFTGQDASLAAGTIVPTGFTLVDFRLGDYLTFSNLLYPPATLHADYTAGGAGGGTLSLVDQNNVVQGRIALLGDYVGDTFLVAQEYNTAGVIVLPQAATKGTAPVGTATPEVYYFKDYRVGSWDDVANWSVSSYSTPTTAPGSADEVELGNDGAFLPQVVVGVGAADTITANGAVALDGRFSANLVLGNNLTVGGLGSVLTVGTLLANVILDASIVRVGGLAQAASISLSQGATMTAASLALEGFSISVDAQSSLLIGSSAESAALGTVTVASDGTISGGGTIEGALRDDGRIVSDGLTVDGPVTGTGTLAIDGFPGLTLSGAAASTLTVALSGSDLPVFLYDPHDMQATIAGFATGDTIELAGIFLATQAHYTYLGNDFGQVTLADADGTTLDVLRLAGDYRGATFALATDTGYGQVYGQQITVAGHKV